MSRETPESEVIGGDTENKSKDPGNVEKFKSQLIALYEKSIEGKTAEAIDGKKELYSQLLERYDEDIKEMVDLGLTVAAGLLVIGSFLVAFDVAYNYVRFSPEAFNLDNFWAAYHSSADPLKLGVGPNQPMLVGPEEYSRLHADALKEYNDLQNFWFSIAGAIGGLSAPVVGLALATVEDELFGERPRRTGVKPYAAGRYESMTGSKPAEGSF